MIRILLALVLMTSTASAQLGGGYAGGGLSGGDFGGGGLGGGDYDGGFRKPVPVKTFSADGADVKTLATILGDQFPGITFSVDQTSSTIFARVDGEDAEGVKAIIEELRMRAAEANDRRMKIEEKQNQELEAAYEIANSRTLQGESKSQLRSFQLQHVSAEEAGRVLSLLDYDEKAVVAVVGANLMVRASADALEEITEVLQQMDTPSKVSTQSDVLLERAVQMMPDIEPALAVQRLRQLTERKVDADQRELKILQMQAVELAHEVRTNENAGQQEKLMQALHENVTHQFHKKLQQDRREMEQIRRRLDQISQRLEMQERLAGRIIDQRVQELLERQNEPVSDRDRGRSKNSDSDDQRLLQELEMIETQLEKLQAIQQQQGAELEGQLAERQAELEAAYRELKQRLDPIAFETNHEVEEAERTNDESIHEEPPVSAPDDTEQQ